MTRPMTATGRKVLAIHGTSLMDDILGIEAEAAVLNVERLALAIETSSMAHTDDAERWAPLVAAEYARLASVEEMVR